MKTVVKFLVIMLAIVSLSACGGSSSENESVQADLQSNVKASKILIAEIDSLEKIVYQDDYEIDGDATVNLMKAYTAYTTQFIGDKQKAPEYLYKSAAISREVGLPIKAIKLYDQILVDYPGFERNPEVAFLLAYTYDEDMKQFDRAKEEYLEVIEKYPGDKWAEEAAANLAILGQSNEDVVKSFMEKEQVKEAE